MKLHGPALALIALAACAHRAPPPLGKPFVAPDGRAGFAVTCNEKKATLATCHEKARTLCQGDYEVIDTSEAEKLHTNGWTGMQATISQRAMNVACKKSPK